MSGAGVFAVVPVKDLRGTKSRLAPILDPCARAGLTLYMMRRVVKRLIEAEVDEVRVVDEVCVVSPDGVVLEEAKEIGATPLFQRSEGLNPALEEGRDFALGKGASSLLVVPADLPLVEGEDILAFLESAKGSSVAIAPDGAGTGTNALLLSPPDAIPFLFGPGSFERHAAAARERGLPTEVFGIPRLAFDLDTAEDFARFDGARTAGMHCEGNL
ncbi:MAG: 2-phospho-L-lactate guanylyltransferase [Actinomycetota bacterium]|jgi:2-phospho-L-lactate guanylyltransferase|nr:2-phospho-L-lactate guanylyltransferase [Actinomycetota bacterium]